MDLNADRAIAFASAVVAGAALFVAVWQGILMRRHNRISVRPNLRFDLPLDDGPLRAIIRNTAYGPAYVQRVVLAVDDAEVEGSLTEALRTAFLKLGLNGLTVYGNVPYEGTSIAAGEEYPLFTLVNTKEGDPLRERAVSEIRRLSVQLSFTSIYGEKFNNRAVFAYVLR